MLINESINILHFAGLSKAFSILKTIQEVKEVHYSTLLKFHFKPGNGSLAYYLKRFKKAGLVRKIECGRKYVLTENGYTVIEVLERFQKKYIAEDQSSICKNNKDEEHKFKTICINCGYIPKEKNSN